MSDTLTVNVLMDSLHNSRNHSIQKILNQRLALSSSLKNNPIPWQASCYHLDQVGLFQELPYLAQQQVLYNCAQDRIEEAYHIEKSGMAYGAKMILLNQTLEERKLYSFFVADEARHFSIVAQYLDRGPGNTHENSFLTFLSSTIEQAPRNALVFLIQVVLEGWGLGHYRELANTCTNSRLKQDLHAILQDEVGHHASGLLLFDTKALTKEDWAYILNSLRTFLMMVKVGPCGVVTRLLEQLPYQLEQKEISQIMIEMGAPQSTQKKLDLLSRLMKKAGATEFIQMMEHEGFLQAYGPEQMAHCF